MLFYLFNLTPPFGGITPPFPFTFFVEGNPPSYNEKTYGFFLRDFMFTPL